MRSRSRSAHLGIDAVLDKAALALPLHIVVTRELGEAPAHKHITLALLKTMYYEYSENCKIKYAATTATAS